ncbi:MAG: SDR family NAD(P)-dependent oxidoreductase [bacterium]
MERVLVTGGAGVIGSHITDLLLEEGYEVRVLDSLEPQVHGERDSAPDYLNPEAEFIKGDVRDKDVLDRALSDVDMVCHQAAMVGVAQSMYEIDRYVHGNDCVTASLLQGIVDRIPKSGRIKKLVVASSMSIYGEGRYRCPNCGLVAPRVRSNEQLERREWELRCDCGEVLEAVPTDEAKSLICESVYAIGKKVTEELALVIGRAYGIPTVALRYFNIYGPRQALSNPYTGLLAIVASRVRNERPALIFEDGRQCRDFTYVRDAARANLAALRWGGEGGVAVNVGTGKPRSVLDVADAVRDGLGGDLPHEVQGAFRSGDIRHCYADTGLAREVLDYETATSFEEGLPVFLDWAAEEEGVEDLVQKGVSELKDKGLIK